MNGSIAYQGQSYWFDFYCSTKESGNPYYYLVYALSDQEAAFADSWSAESERLGSDWAPLANDPQTEDSPAAKGLAERWKAHEALLPDYSKREPVAWFVSGSNPSFYGVQVS